MGFEVDVKLDEVGGDVQSFHFESFKDDTLAVLGLIEGGVVVGDGGGAFEVLLAPGGELMGGFAAVSVEQRACI